MLGLIAITLFEPNFLMKGSVRYLFWSRGAVNRESLGSAGFYNSASINFYDMFPSAYESQRSTKSPVRTNILS